MEYRAFGKIVLLSIALPLTFAVKDRHKRPMEYHAAGIASGVLMIIGGISVYLQGSGRLPVSRSIEKQATWLIHVGPIFKWGGPIMILSGLLKLAISIS